MGYWIPDQVGNDKELGSKILENEKVAVADFVEFGELVVDGTDEIGVVFV